MGGCSGWRECSLCQSATEKWVKKSRESIHFVGFSTILQFCFYLHIRNVCVCAFFWEDCQCQSTACCWQVSCRLSSRWITACWQIISYSGRYHKNHLRFVSHSLDLHPNFSSILRSSIQLTQVLGVGWNGNQPAPSTCTVPKNVRACLLFKRLRENTFSMCSLLTYIYTFFFFFNITMDRMNHLHRSILMIDIWPFFHDVSGHVYLAIFRWNFNGHFSRVSTCFNGWTSEAQYVWRNWWRPCTRRAGRWHGSIVSSLLPAEKKWGFP